MYHKLLMLCGRCAKLTILHAKILPAAVIWAMDRDLLPWILGGALITTGAIAAAIQFNGHSQSPAIAPRTSPAPSAGAGSGLAVSVPAAWPELLDSVSGARLRAAASATSAATRSGATETLSG